MQSTASAPRRGATQFSQLSLVWSPEVDHNLVVHFRRLTFLIVPSPETLVLGATPRWPISLRNSPPNRKRGARSATTSESSGSATASSWHSRPKPSSVGAARTVNPASPAPPACGLVGPADRPAPHPPPKVQRTAGPRRPDPRRGIFAPGPKGTFLLGRNGDIPPCA
jgi:hypothetical protein